MKIIGYRNTQNPAGSPKLTRRTAKTDEFGKFEALTRKLVNTPKDELDEKRKPES